MCDPYSDLSILLHGVISLSDATSYDKFIEDIYFFEVNTKYISSSAVKNQYFSRVRISSSAVKNQYFSRVRSTSENADIFTARDEIYLVFAKKSKFSFYFILNRNTEITTVLFTWSFLVRSDFSSVFIGYSVGCKRSL